MSLPPSSSSPPSREQAATDSSRPPAGAGAARSQLIALLQGAHAGELAASLAYDGHQRSVADREQAERIRKVRDEELQHRARVGEMLAELGSGPAPARERRFRTLGKLLGKSCHLSGWLLPMFGAGFLESHNVREYEQAARLALQVGRADWIDELLTMAEVEWDHEHLFRSWIRAHPRWARLPLWKAPPPRENIRTTFEADTGYLPATAAGTASRTS